MPKESVDSVNPVAPRESVDSVDPVAPNVDSVNPVAPNVDSVDPVAPQGSVDSVDPEESGNSVPGSQNLSGNVQAGRTEDEDSMSGQKGSVNTLPVSVEQPKVSTLSAKNPDQTVDSGVEIPKEITLFRRMLAGPTPMSVVNSYLENPKHAWMMSSSWGTELTEEYSKRLERE